MRSAGGLRPARPTLIILAVQAVALIGLAGRYGYHRDELYFLACGRHPAWGYPDQPPLTPMLARLGDWLAPHSLLVFRLPVVLIALWVTLLAAAIARELGGGEQSHPQ